MVMDNNSGFEISITVTVEIYSETKTYTLLAISMRVVVCSHVWILFKRTHVIIFHIFVANSSGEM